MPRRGAPGTADILFDPWAIPGRKWLRHVGKALVLQATQRDQTLNASVEAQLGSGDAIAVQVELGATLRSSLPSLEAQAAMLRGIATPANARKADRAALLHVGALQALDGWLAGASQRDIGSVLFGSDELVARWTADGELRARVRHLLARGQGLMRGGYLALAGLRPEGAGTHGDEQPP